MDKLAIYLCSVREMPPAIENHLVDTCLIPCQGPLPQQCTDEPAAVLFCVSRSLQLSACLEIHFLAWKIYMKYSLQLLKKSPLINFLLLWGPVYSVPTPIICVLKWCSQLFPQFLFPARLYEFTESKDYVFFVVIASQCKEKLNICLIN